MVRQSTVEAILDVESSGIVVCVIRTNLLTTKRDDDEEKKNEMLEESNIVRSHLSNKIECSNAMPKTKQTSASQSLPQASTNPMSLHILQQQPIEHLSKWTYLLGKTNAYYQHLFMSPTVNSYS
jgi:hypothetical protein